jgi:hypothetical protein
MIAYRKSTNTEIENKNSVLRKKLVHELDKIGIEVEDTAYLQRKKSYGVFTKSNKIKVACFGGSTEEAKTLLTPNHTEFLKDGTKISYTLLPAKNA